MAQHNVLNGHIQLIISIIRIIMHYIKSNPKARPSLEDFTVTFDNCIEMPRGTAF